MPERFEIQVDGRALQVEAGLTVAAALQNAGQPFTRRSISGEARGPLCAMGICFECRVTIDGEPHRRACVESCRPGMRITTGTEPGTDPQSGIASAAAVDAGLPVATELEADVAVVGGGPAGIAAACRASESGARVVLIDEGARPGGQIWRHRADPPKAARAWLARLARAAVTVVGDTSVIEVLAHGGEAALPAAAGSFTLHAVRAGSEPTCVRARRVVLANGARERFLPFPGWTLPGVLGIGALQALLKSGASFAGRRVVLAGSGPLLLPVTAALAENGAYVVMVAEQAEASAVLRFGLGLWRHPGKIVEAFRYRWAFLGTRLRHGVWAISAGGDERVRSVTLTNGERSWSESCDLLGTSYGLVPNLELARLVGCALEGGAVMVDAWQGTSVPGVFAAGEPTGIGGVERAVVEGEIAGLAAAGREADARLLLPRRERLHAFSRALEAAFALRPELRQLVRSETLVCRCEDVAYGTLDPEWGARRAKLYTRLGMGACQGRVCGAACAHLFGWTPDTMRPPLLPVPLGALETARGADR